MLKFNGRPFRPGDFEKAIEKTMLEGARKAIRGRLEAIRHPQTGEFPTVVIRGDSLSNLHAQVEGSPQLLALVRERLSPEDLARMNLKELTSPRSIKVFLSYGGEDRDLAKLIAHKLVASGIDTWWAEWELNAGDSLRQRIDEGLASCTHFLVLLTPTARTKPWVNQEMDAGLVRRLQQQSRFIPLRHNLPVTELPSLLSGMLSPEVDASASDIESLINQILEVNRKPALASPACTLAEEHLEIVERIGNEFRSWFQSIASTSVQCGAILRADGSVAAEPVFHFKRGDKWMACFSSPLTQFVTQELLDLGVTPIRPGEDLQ